MQAQACAKIHILARCVQSVGEREDRERKPLYIFCQADAGKPDLLCPVGQVEQTPWDEVSLDAFSSGNDKATPSCPESVLIDAVLFPCNNCQNYAHT